MPLNLYFSNCSQRDRGRQGQKSCLSLNICDMALSYCPLVLLKKESGNTCWLSVSTALFSPCLFTQHLFWNTVQDPNKRLQILLTLFSLKSKHIASKMASGALSTSSAGRQEFPYNLFFHPELVPHLSNLISPRLVKRLILLYREVKCRIGTNEFCILHHPIGSNHYSQNRT